MVFGLSQPLHEHLEREGCVTRSRPVKPAQPVSDLHTAAIRRQAQAWVVMLSSGEACAADVAAARAWCEAAPAHQAAFVEARRVWVLYGRLPQSSSASGNYYGEPRNFMVTLRGQY